MRATGVKPGTGPQHPWLPVYSLCLHTLHAIILHPFLLLAFRVVKLVYFLPANWLDFIFSASTGQAQPGLIRGPGVDSSASFSFWFVLPLSSNTRGVS